MSSTDAYDAWNAAFGLSDSTKAMLADYLPWYDIGLGWIVPALIGFVLGIILSLVGGKRVA